MKRLLLPAILFTLFTSPAVHAKKAGKKDKPIPMPEDIVKKVESKVDLTPEQRTQLETIVLQFHREIGPLIVDGKISAENKIKYKALKSAEAQAIAAILTPEQREKIEALHKAKQAAKEKARQPKGD